MSVEVRRGLRRRAGLGGFDLRAGFGWLALLVCSACGTSGESAEARSENLLLISVDTLRADHLGTYGYGRATSPNLDALAERGVVFENAMSTASWTLPSHVSLLTGLYPSQHRVQDDGVQLGDAVPTLAEHMRAAGFHTFAVVSHVYVASSFGLDRGFDVFDDALIEGGTTNPRGDAVVDRFLAHLDARPSASSAGDTDRAEPGEANPASPFFGFLHLYDPHWDYTPPAPFAARFVDPAYAGSIDGRYESMKPWLHATTAMPEPDRRALVGRYDGEIAWLDTQLGRLFEALAARGLLDRTTIVLTADHGEEFKEHKRLGHGRTLFVEQLHVPLVIAGHPALARGRRAEPVSLIDVAPTLLDLFGAAPLAGAAGRSLADRAPHGDRVLFAESIRFGIELRAARSGRYKLIQVPANDWSLFFDLAEDPMERQPRRADPSGGRLTTALDEFVAASEVGWHLKLVGMDETPLHLRARLRSEGRFVDPRHYSSARIAGSETRFERFEVLPSGRELALDVIVERNLASIRFETDPPGAALEIEVEALAGGAIHVGGAAIDPVQPGQPLRFERDAEAVAARFAGPAQLSSGLHVRASAARAALTRADPLSEAARRRLEALGYLDPHGQSARDSTDPIDSTDSADSTD